MADENRIEADSLSRKLRDSPYEFDFFQAVRRLECNYQGRPLIGCSKRPQEDPVRFCQNVSLAFPPSSLAAYYPAADGRPARLLVNFFGLLGNNGPMPLDITEYVHNRLHNFGDRTLASFLDIFNHRLISLFYRAWACNRQNVSFDRQGEDRFAVFFGSLFGIGEETLRNRDIVPDVAKLHYSGRLVCQTRNAEGLQAILQDYFGLAVNINQFVGHWRILPREYRCRLGQSPDSGTMGSTLIIGSRFWICQERFRIRLGPMSFSNYQRMLPEGDSASRLIAWVKNYVGDEFSWEVQLILRNEEVPSICLGRLGQLGWTTWLRSKPFEKDADDLVLRTLVA